MIQLLVILIVVGVILWFVNTKIPMPDWVKTVINVVAAICVLLFLLNAFGVMDIPVPQYHKR